MELEECLSEIDAQDFGGVVLRARIVIGLRVEAKGTAGACAARSAGALSGGSSARLFDGGGGDAGPGGVAGDADEAAVDDRDDAVDRDARLGDVGREDDLSL